MLNPESVNAKEVLTHLKSLGYCDITPKQFKEFLHDLKKLIKYDLKQVSENKILEGKSECGCSCSQCCENSANSSTTDYISDSLDSVCSTSTAQNPTKSMKLSEITKRFNHPTDSEIAQKAQISFIRPWNIQGKDFSTRGRKNVDPVRLYHQYKKLWNRQGIPGESKHSDLRWVIRNKMLGQEPNPRVNACNH